ncbi:MAG TPA: hypothetical protein VMW27_03985 [Thermoanaerobaculia bacterium]|nr:hypothetical protein [Thermoanaerobaculia bacterium]
MGLDVSITTLLADLEEQIVFHRSQEELHTREEEMHRERRAFHAAEHERISRHYEQFKAAAAQVAEIAGQGSGRRPAPVVEEDAPAFYGKRPMVSRMVDRVVDNKPADASFGATEVTAEINRRFARSLRKAVDARTVAVTLRRMSLAGRLRLVREGRAFHEALYSRTAPE